MLSRYCRKLKLAAGFLTTLMLTGCSFQQLMQVSDTTGASQPAGIAAPVAVQREYNRALASLDKGDMAAAEERLQRFIEQYPSYTNAYVNLAIIKDQQGDSEAATHLLQHAVEMDGDNVYALNRLGLIQREGGDFAAAEQSWLEATRVNPEYPNAWYNLGVLYDLYLRDLQAAVDNYQRYQDLAGVAGNADAGVARWITDLERRIDSAPQTASATETL